MSRQLTLRPLAAQSDGRLVELAGKGNERAFEAMVRRYRPALLRYCARIGLSEAPAEDVVQRSLAKAWLALVRGTPVRELKPWLYRIVHNQAISAVRGGRGQPVKLSESVEDSLRGTTTDQAEERLAAREALGKLAALPERQREALVLTAVEGRSHEEAATVLGVSDGAVRGLVHRARVTLRDAAAALFPPGLQVWLSGGSQPGSQPVPLLEGSSSVSSAGRLVGVTALIAKGAVLAVASGLILAGTAHLRAPHERTSPAVAKQTARALPRSPTAGATGPRQATMPLGRPGLRRADAVAPRRRTGHDRQLRHRQVRPLARAHARQSPAYAAPAVAGTRRRPWARRQSRPRRSQLHNGSPQLARPRGTARPRVQRRDQASSPAPPRATREGRRAASRCVPAARCGR